jgi:hypothetical protein
MSEKIGTRNSVQCRSHHQKMLKKYKTIPQIIKELGRELTAQQHEQEANKKIEELKNFVEVERVENELSIWNDMINIDSKKELDHDCMF